MKQENRVSAEDYLKSIEEWIASSINDISIVPGRTDLACYGTGYNSWGVQTHQKAFAAYAIFSMLMKDNKKTAGKTKTELIDLAIKMLRFSLESHLEGASSCLDNTKWGHTWISVLGIERMMPGVDAIFEKLSGHDKALLEKVLLSEANWLLNEYQIIASPDNTSLNKPESNLWNGAFLHRAALMYPACPDAEKYREKGSRFLLNSISVPSDSGIADIIDGKKVSDWHIGGNFQESYALIHHGYLNVGYMVICLSNIAMLHFSYKERGIEAPESLYHHADDLWQLVKKLTYPDGRLIRIGGDTRVRYSYCQDYAIPAWLFIADKYDNPECLDFEKRWFETVKKEQAFNADGSFTRKRLETLKEKSPLYYTRLESDRAVTLAMAALWHKRFPVKIKENTKNGASSRFEWHDNFHGASFVRSDKNVRSWVWMAARNPFGLCLPIDDSSLAEWDYNCSGQIKGTGVAYTFKLLNHNESRFNSGFITMGKFQVLSTGQLGEGQKDDIAAEEQIVFTALPDGASVLCMQYAKAHYRVYTQSIKGLMLPIPNDIFNDFTRVFTTPEKSITLKGLDAPHGLVSIDSKLVNIDGKLTVELLYGSDSLVINRQAERQITIKNREPAGGNLYAEEICSKCFSGLKKYESGELILDECFSVQTGALPAQPGFIEMEVEESSPECRVAAFKDADGKVYILAANFGKEEGLIRFREAIRATEKGKTFSGKQISLKPETCALLTLLDN